MGIFYFIGVDVSKKKLDFRVMFEGKVVHGEETANHQSAVMSLLRHLEEDCRIDNSLWLENAAEIKYSSGVRRGKNGK